MNRQKIILLLILILATFLRFYKLGENPPSLDWDEASLGYNAYSILQTGRDEYGNFLPFSIRSFNDYKPPLYVYITVPSVAFFGLNEFAVRLPSAISGVLTVSLIYFLIKELFYSEKKTNSKELEILATLTTLLISINPWHLQFSRVAFEANLALFLFVLGTHFLLKAMRSGKILFFMISTLSFVATIYSYHSSRLIVPAFLFILLIVFKKTLTVYKKQIAISLITGLVLLTPISLSFLRGSAQARFSTVSVFTNLGIYTQEQELTERQEAYRKKDFEDNSKFSLIHHPWVTTAKIITEGYFDHFDFRYLFLEGDDIGRHSAVGMGLMYWWEAPFLITGIYFLAKKRPWANYVIFSWLLAAPIAASLTTHTPHAVRSLLMLPMLEAITAFGLLYFIKVVKYHKTAIIFISFIAIVNLAYYLDLYHVHTPVERSNDWVYGYKQLVQKVNTLKSDVNEVIITRDYDQPYIFFLFYEQTDPSWYQQISANGSAHFDKYFFRTLNYSFEREIKNNLVVGVPKEIPDEAKIIEEIEFLNGETAFLLVET